MMVGDDGHVFVTPALIVLPSPHSANENFPRRIGRMKKFKSTTETSASPSSEPGYTSLLELSNFDKLQFWCARSSLNLHRIQGRLVREHSISSARPHTSIASGAFNLNNSFNDIGQPLFDTLLHFVHFPFPSATITSFESLP
jgi:hypothetical protein